MFGKRLKQLRLAKGYSLDELVAAMGGIVSKVALSKYENDLMKPSNKVLVSLAKVFDIKTINLINPPDIRVEFIAYRKGSGLSKGEQVRIENLVTTKLEERVHVQNLLYTSFKPNIPIKKYEIKNYDDVEEASVEIRKKWSVGLDPLANITQLLEDNFIHTIFIDSNKPFDGISALAYEQNQLKAAAVVSKTHIPGERQRLNIAHELGHIVLDVKSDLDEEKAAFRFGGALLAPSETITKIAGKNRNHFQFRELFIFKKIFGLSIQALLFRLKDLNIISATTFSLWYQIINKNNWKRNEPMPMDEERSLWMERNVLRAYSEGLISPDEVRRLTGEKVDKQNLSLIMKKKFMKLSQTDREKILSEQAAKFMQYYESDKTIQNLGAGDFIEY
jgi:Zn-dependent peptidase ImmA (M78 family)/DNA-binding XRE family transcriptional regulator